MQNDLDRLWRYKRRARRVQVVLIISIIAALIIVGIRSCSEQYQEPYNRDYRPVDIEHEQQNIVRPGS